MSRKTKKQKEEIRSSRGAVVGVGDQVWKTRGIGHTISAIVVIIFSLEE